MNTCHRVCPTMTMGTLILVPRAYDPSGLWQGWRALAWSNTGSPRFTDFPSNLVGREYVKNSLRILRKSGPARALDPCHRPEGSWALGTRISVGTLWLPCCTHTTSSRIQKRYANTTEIMVFHTRLNIACRLWCPGVPKWSRWNQMISSPIETKIQIPSNVIQEIQDCPKVVPKT